MPSTDSRNGLTLPFRCSRNMPPTCSPRSASRNEPSCSNAMPLGRKGRFSGNAAVNSATVPSARRCATPPRQSALYSDPSAQASTHSGRFKPLPTKRKSCRSIRLTALRAVIARSARDGYAVSTREHFATAMCTLKNTLMYTLSNKDLQVKSLRKSLGQSLQQALRQSLRLSLQRSPGQLLR